MQFILRAILTTQKNMGCYSGNCELKEKHTKPSQLIIGGTSGHRPEKSF